MLDSQDASQTAGMVQSLVEDENIIDSTIAGVLQEGSESQDLELSHTTVAVFCRVMVIVDYIIESRLLRFLRFLVVLRQMLETCG